MAVGHVYKNNVQGAKRKMKRIYILLTARPGIGSKAVRILTLSRYSHASVGLEEDLSHFFSFVTGEGFRKEYPLKSKKAKKRAARCELYRIDVPDDTYNTLELALEDFRRNSSDYSYNALGVVLMILKFPYPRKRCYF
ncbi:MAG: hypothetical protein ACRDBM_02950, partial [Sporomusa sp.]